MQKYHKFYVPREMWEQIEEQADDIPGVSAKELAKTYLMTGIYGPSSTGAPKLPKSERKKITKNNSTKNIDINNKKIYVYNGEDHCFIGENDPDVFFKAIERFRLIGTRMSGPEQMEENLTIVTRPTSETPTAQQLDAMYSVSESMYHEAQEYEKLSKDQRHKFNMNTPVTGEVVPYVGD